MGSPRKLAQEALRLGLVGRLPKHGAVEHDDRVRADDDGGLVCVLGDGDGLDARVVLGERGGVAVRGCRFLGVARDDVEVEARGAEQVAATGRSGCEYE